MIWLWIYAARCAAIIIFHGYSDGPGADLAIERVQRWSTLFCIVSWPLWFTYAVLHFCGQMLRDFREECRPTDKGDTHDQT